MEGSVRRVVVSALAVFLLLGFASASAAGARVTPTIVDSLATDGHAAAPGPRIYEGEGEGASASDNDEKEDMRHPKIVKSLSSDNGNGNGNENGNGNGNADVDVVTVTRPTVHVQAVPTVTTASEPIHSNSTNGNATAAPADIAVESTPCGCTKAATIVPTIKSKCDECDTCEQVITPKIVDGCGSLGKSTCDPIDSIEQFYYEAYTDEQLKKALSDIEGAMARIYKHVSGHSASVNETAVQYSDKSEVEGDTIFPTTKEESKSNQTLQESGANKMPAENTNPVDGPIEQAEVDRLVQLAINASATAGHLDPYWNKCYDTWKIHGLNSTWFSRMHKNFTKL